jgi:triosephosphate isomerase
MAANKSSMKYVIGNWKMNGDGALLARFPTTEKNAVLCVPFHLISPGLGAQDCSAFEDGARTGEISAKMLSDAGVKYCIVGHSERRKYHNETDGLVAAKAAMCLKYGITPIVCVENPGQVAGSVPETDGKIIVAFEPTDCIGTGKTPTMDEIKKVHGQIAELVPGTAILYGGSVTPANAREILAIDNVGGVLVGGASLDPEKFKEIINAGR